MNDYQAAVARIARDLDLPPLSRYHFQDWEYCAAEAKDLRKYLDYISEHRLDVMETHIVLMLILQAADDTISTTQSDGGDDFLRLIEVIQQHAAMHGCLFDYWCCWQDDDPEHHFHLTPFVRDHHVKLEKPLAKVCAQCRSESTFRDHESDV
jgi:hypothetical protein